MHLLCVLGGVARVNYMWLPGWVAFNTKLQQKALDATKKEFYEKHNRQPTTSEEDMEELDRIIIKHIADLVPASGIRTLLRSVTKVRLSPRKSVPISGREVDMGSEVGLNGASSNVASDTTEGE